MQYYEIKPGANKPRKISLKRGVIKNLPATQENLSEGF